MNISRKYLTAVLSFLCLLLGISAFAQTAPAAEVEMADQFRADGKIYVVVGVLAVILAGILIFLFMIDRKLSNLEKQIKS
jgi:uncharacterized membrane protein